MCDLCVFIEMLKEDARKSRSKDPFNWKEFLVMVLIVVFVCGAGYVVYYCVAK